MSEHNYLMSVVGEDRPGIVYEVFSVLSSLGSGVQRLSSDNLNGYFTIFVYFTNDLEIDGLYKEIEKIFSDDLSLHLINVKKHCCNDEVHLNEKITAIFTCHENIAIDKFKELLCLIKDHNVNIEDMNIVSSEYGFLSKIYSELSTFDREDFDSLAESFGLFSSGLSIRYS